MSIEKIIKAEFNKLGFNLCGITIPQIAPHYSDFLNWVNQGFHANMNYLSNHDSLEIRKNPINLWPDCKSIIVLAKQYADPLQSSSINSTYGEIASYAWQIDYHKTLPHLLSEAMENVHTLSNISFTYRTYTDSSPILERDFAQQAGLGWIGKNTNLISPKLGSFFFLAEIFLDIKLTPDIPFSKDYCGNCTNCLDSCPTNSIKEGRLLDSNTCISYLTIENKGPIPKQLRNKIGNNVFGCDICQKVCPWNQKAVLTKTTEVKSDFPISLSADEILADLQLTPQGFNQKFKNSPIKRAKRRGYLRNLCVAAGNSKNPIFVSILSDLLVKDFEVLIKGHAAWALGKIGTENSKKILLQQSVVEKDISVLEEINHALSMFSDG